MPSLARACGGPNHHGGRDSSPASDVGRSKGVPQAGSSREPGGELKPLSMVWPNLDKRNFHDCFEGRSWVVTLVKALEGS